MTSFDACKGEEGKWLLDKRYQTVLKAIHTIAYEYNPVTKEQTVSPFINEYIAGNYDGRLLSHVMVEDNVIHPEDLSKAVAFRDQLNNASSAEMTLRLRTPCGSFRWFKMCLCPYSGNDSFYYLGTITDVDKEIRYTETLRYRAEYDLTTGIYNKTTFYNATEKWLREEPDVLRCLISFDIDRFKIINESYSLSEGDKVLSYIGNLLKNMTYSNETYARNSSDIFFVCLGRSKKGSTDFIAELEHKLNMYPIDFQFILSAGIVCIDNYNKEPINVLCDWAAMAQRTVKGNFITHYAFYEPYMTEALAKEHYITKHMKNALRNHQFQIYLQPKFDIRDRSIVGAEALCRWIHPTRGVISPGEFIPLFERNGFILRLDEYVWELACKTLRQWMDEGHKTVPISVNVSRIHLRDPDLCTKLINLMDKYRLPPSLLELEITESAYTDNPAAFYDVMDKLQTAGFIFSMDDFGSGYSSLNSLKDIPVNIVKIDLNFLHKARLGPETGQDILRGTIRLIQGINLPVIAEGVETKEQADFLLNIGCLHAQGFYYAKPMPVSDFKKLFMSSK